MIHDFFFTPGAAVAGRRAFANAGFTLEARSSNSLSFPSNVVAELKPSRRIVTDLLGASLHDSNVVAELKR